MSATPVLSVPSQMSTLIGNDGSKLSHQVNNSAKIGKASFVRTEDPQMSMKPMKMFYTENGNTLVPPRNKPGKVRTKFGGATKVV